MTETKNGNINYWHFSFDFSFTLTCFLLEINGLFLSLLQSCAWTYLYLIPIQPSRSKRHDEFVCTFIFFCQQNIFAETGKYICWGRRFALLKYFFVVYSHSLPSVSMKYFLRPCCIHKPSRKTCLMNTLSLSDSQSRRHIACVVHNKTGTEGQLAQSWEHKIRHQLLARIQRQVQNQLMRTLDQCVQ